MAKQILKQTIFESGGTPTLRTETWKSKFKRFTPPTWKIFSWAYNVCISELNIPNDGSTINIQIDSKTGTICQYADDTFQSEHTNSSNE